MKTAEEERDVLDDCIIKLYEEEEYALGMDVLLAMHFNTWLTGGLQYKKYEDRGNIPPNELEKLAKKGDFRGFIE